MDIKEQMEKTAIVYSGPGWNWCERVKVLLIDNGYEVEEKSITNKGNLEQFQNKFNQMMKTIPQVVIDDELIGGYAETEAMMKGLKSISKIWVTGVLWIVSGKSYIGQTTLDLNYVTLKNMQRK